MFSLLAMFPSLCQATGGKLHIFPSDSLQKPERSAPQLMVDGSWEDEDPHRSLMIAMLIYVFYVNKPHWQVQYLTLW